MIRIRRAVAMDAAGIAAVHVAAWRSAYPGILPDAYLARLSVGRQTLMYQRSILRGVAVYVAYNPRPEVGRQRVVGFATGMPRVHALGDGEIETLYVLDDWRDRGIGRKLMAVVARDLAVAGCASAYCWVLRDNPSRWFYQHIGGREAANAIVRVGGADIPQTAFAWDPIERLFAPAADGALG